MERRRCRAGEKRKEKSNYKNLKSKQKQEEKEGDKENQNNIRGKNWMQKSWQLPKL